MLHPNSTTLPTHPKKTEHSVTIYNTAVASADWLKNTWLNWALILAASIFSVACRAAIGWIRGYTRLADYDATLIRISLISYLTGNTGSYFQCCVLRCYWLNKPIKTI